MRKLKKALFFVLLTSCSYRQVDTLRFDSSEYRCAADGLCLHATGEFSLQAGYREGAAEIRIDVLDAQTQRKNSPQNFAVRVIDQHLNPLLLSDNGRMPKSWNVKHQTSHMIVNMPEFCLEAPVREALVERMAVQLKKRGDAKDIGRQDAYEVALQITEEMAAMYRRTRSGEQEPRGSEDTKTSESAKTGMLLAPRSISPQIDFSYSPHDLHEALALAKVTSFGRDEAAYRRLQQQAQPTLSGTFLEAYPHDHEDYTRADLTEFHQTVYLWKKLAPAIMRIFPFEGAEHSASAIQLRLRRAETGYAWLLARIHRTRNHGTEAEASTMTHYATCDMYPPTFGYFAWKGDCDGHWGIDHLCNDDTALQLYHAAGNWSGGRHCPITHRKHAPYCDAVWERNGERIFSTIHWGWF